MKLSDITSFRSKLYFGAFLFLMLFWAVHSSIDLYQNRFYYMNKCFAFEGLENKVAVDGVGIFD